MLSLFLDLSLSRSHKRHAVRSKNQQDSMQKQPSAPSDHPPPAVSFYSSHSSLRKPINWWGSPLPSAASCRAGPCLASRHLTSCLFRRSCSEKHWRVAFRAAPTSVPSECRFLEEPPFVWFQGEARSHAALQPWRQRKTPHQGHGPTIPTLL